MTRRLSDGPFLGAAFDVADLFELTDVSDTSESPQGTTKTLTGQNILDGVAANLQAVFKGQHTWALSGPYAPADTIAEMRMELGANQSTALTRVSVVNGTGSGQVTVRKNGVAIAAYSSLAVGAVWADTTGSEAVANNDRFDFVIDSSTSGELLSVTLSFTHTVTLA